MHVDIKVSLWKRIELPENVSKDQIIETLKLGEEGINDLFDEFDNLEYNEVENSEETLTPEENQYQATIELYDNNLKGDGPIWTNAEHFYKSPQTEKIKRAMEYLIDGELSVAEQVELIENFNGDKHTLIDNVSDDICVWEAVEYRLSVAEFLECINPANYH